MHLTHSQAPDSLQDQVQVCREPRVRELRRSVVMVNKINPARRCISDLPSRRQWTKLFTIDVAKIPVKTNIK